MYPRKLFFALLLFTGTFAAQAQRHEIGLALGAGNFLGDLGGANHVGRTFLFDVNPQLFMPAGGIFYRYNFKKFVSLEVNLYATEVKGDDKLLAAGPVYSDFWFRHYRNLNFRSPIVELNVMAEFDLLRYKKSYFNHSYWTPYVSAGVGLFFMDPQANYGGKWVHLKPLGTEGQGLPGYKPKYSLIQPNFPVSIGIKYQLNEHWKFSVEYLHHFTLTDYIDDVSGSYVDPAVLYANYDKASADLIYGLSRRSQEIDPENVYGAVTAPGEQRGNPRNKDNYFMLLFKVSYVFHSRHEYDCFIPR